MLKEGTKSKQGSYCLTLFARVPPARYVVRIHSYQCPWCVSQDRILTVFAKQINRFGSLLHPPADQRKLWNAILIIAVICALSQKGRMQLCSFYHSFFLLPMYIVYSTTHFLRVADFGTKLDKDWPAVEQWILFRTQRWMNWVQDGLQLYLLRILQMRSI